MPSTTVRPWLSLGPASRLLGVDPGTLRRWADEGRIPVYTTPGGHRRFERKAVERVATERRPGTGRSSTRPPARPLASLGTTPERMQRVYRRSYATATTAPAPDQDREPGAPPTTDADREAYRHDGRRLIAVLIAYLDTDPLDALDRNAAEAEATALVEDLAARVATTGTSLTEAVALFIAARRPFLAELAGLGRRRTLDPGRLGALYEDASGLLDRLLLRLIATYQEVPR